MRGGFLVSPSNLSEGGEAMQSTCELSNKKKKQTVIIPEKLQVLFVPYIVESIPVNWEKIPY